MGQKQIRELMTDNPCAIDAEKPVSHAAKMMRILREGGFVISTRGQSGGYALSRPAEQTRCTSPT